MPRLPSHLRLPGPAAKAKAMFLNSLNFYRVHLLVFAIVPLITSAIMFAVNTEFTIQYIDCLFNCMSAFTVTGLATVNLSTLSPLQQVILFVQMIFGSPTVVSVIMIVVRRHFFRVKFKHVIKEEQKRRSAFNLAKTISRVTPSGPPLSALRKRFSMSTMARPEPPKNPSPDNDRRGSDDQVDTPSTVELKPNQPRREPTITLKVPPKPKHGKKKRNISTSMIKRVEGGGVGLVNPMGWYDAPQRAEAQRSQANDESALETSDSENGHTPVRRTSSPQPMGLGLEDVEEHKPLPAVLVDSPPRMDTGEFEESPSQTPYAGRPVPEELFPRSRTIAFDDDEDPSERARGMATGREGAFFPRTATHRSHGVPADALPFSNTTSTLPRTYSLRPVTSRKQDTRMSGFGGFPTPFEIARTLVDKFAPNASRTLTKTLTMPRTATIGPTSTMGRRDTALTAEGSVVSEAPYISFAATVGRNSRFTGLTEEQMDELGGVEYRALRVLLYIVVGYISCLLIAAFIIVAPYIAAGGRYNYVFEEQPRFVPIPWFSLYQVVSAFSNTGMSLVDQSLLPFQEAYVMNFVIFFLIFAGNTAFPVFLRLTVWCIYKASPKTSRLRETLKFLLDHPRRCFVYLFPATQTWVLALVMISLTLTDWVSFLVLDIGTPVVQALPVGTRIAAAFVQSAAVRAAGFAIVPLAQLAPAVKVLYTVMMYISVYPVALSVRSTNVYEEQSLGLYNEEDESEFEADGKGAQAVAKYVGWHARRQLAFDIWWLAFALWLICVIERGNIDNPENATWFTIFNIIFELVSGYGTVGLSLGVPYDNFSFCGSWRKLSKLVLIAVMLRGRHRGLPVAIDRAVMLPKDFTAAEEQEFEETRSRRMSRRGSTGVPDEFLASLRRGSMEGPGRRESSMFETISRDAHMRSPTPHTGATRRETSPPGTLRSRTGSNAPGSPVSTTGHLHFAPSERPERSDPRTRSPGGTRGGALTPVKESSLSRAPTRT